MKFWFSFFGFISKSLLQPILNLKIDSVNESNSPTRLKSPFDPFFITKMANLLYKMHRVVENFALR
jgi:hypothetical protein